MILTLLAIQGPALNRGIFARNFDGTLNEYYASDGTLNEYYASDGTLNEYYASDGTLNEYYASDGPFNANFNRNFGCPAINVTIGEALATGCKHLVIFVCSDDIIIMSVKCVCIQNIIYELIVILVQETN